MLANIDVMYFKIGRTQPRTTVLEWLMPACDNCCRLANKWSAHHQRRHTWGDAMTLLGQAFVFDVFIRTVKGDVQGKSGKGKVGTSVTVAACKVRSLA